MFFSEDVVILQTAVQKLLQSYSLKLGCHPIDVGKYSLPGFVSSGLQLRYYRAKRIGQFAPTSARLYRLLRQSAHGGFTCVTRTNCARDAAEGINGHWLPPLREAENENERLLGFDPRDEAAACEALLLRNPPQASAAAAAAAADDDDDDDDDDSADSDRRLLETHAARLEKEMGAEPGTFRAGSVLNKADNDASASDDASENRSYVASLDATQLYASTLGEEETDCCCCVCV